MKTRNKTMRAGLLLLVLTLVTSCFVGGTFAKYTTSKPGSDTATVAKWGVIVTGQGAGFADKYEAAGSPVVESGYSVQASGKVVAPGTSGTFAENTIAGTPEVAVEVKNEATVTLGENWMVDGTFYCPLKFTITTGKGQQVIDGTQFRSAAELKSAIETKVAEATAVYDPGTDLSGISKSDVTISWEWPFTGNDGKDTKLGDASTKASITVAVKTTVTQVD